jgi:hypothetical protein
MLTIPVFVRFGGIAWFVCACTMAAAAWLVQGVSTDAHATTIYGYIDDQGQPVYTDSLHRVPEKYRSKVRQFEQRAKDQDGAQPPAPTPSPGPTSFMGKVKDLGAKLGAFRIKVGGLSDEQLTVLNYAGGAALLLLVVMYLSKQSPMIRLLAMGLLIILGIGTPVLLYTSEGGALSAIKSKAGESAKLNEERLERSAPR